MRTVWARRREAWLSDCLVSPDVFIPRVARLGAFVVPYQQALETEAGQPPLQLSLQGLRSHVDRKNAETIAAWVNVERPGLQDCIGTTPWAPRPLIAVLVGPVAQQLGPPAGIIACDPSRFPQRGPHSVGVQRPWWSPRGQGDTCQGGGDMG